MDIDKLGRFAKVLELSDVTFCDVSENKFERAFRFGFDAVANGSKARQKWHHRADLVVKATEVPAIAARLTDYFTNGGKGLFFGLCPSQG